MYVATYEHIQYGYLRYSREVDIGLNNKAAAGKKGKVRHTNYLEFAVAVLESLYLVSSHFITLRIVHIVFR